MNEYRERVQTEWAQRERDRKQTIMRVTAVAFILAGGASIMLAVQLALPVIAFVGIVLLMLGTASAVQDDKETG